MGPCKQRATYNLSGQQKQGLKQQIFGTPIHQFKRGNGASISLANVKSIGRLPNRYNTLAKRDPNTRT
ncbi:hypothetical protein GOBAR_DD21125 [Gossypium barbadense]|nr:hypothetical protein GOBAR_DD21125 [Gossypium barbadense]